LTEGQVYSRLEPTICINLISFTLFPELEKFHNCFILTEKDQPEYRLSDQLEIHFVELPKLKNMEDRDFQDRLKMWCYYFGMEGYLEEEDMPILLKDDSLFKKAHREYDHFTVDQEKLILAEAREKWLKDYNSRMQDAEEIGMEKGIEKGIENGIEKGIEKQRQASAQETALKMRTENLDLALISRVTGLTEEEITAL
jgi:predicted transposase/invertase (TIGR01784 family)